MSKVSIIVPVYRTQQWLARCITSITGQTCRDLEIILVDDGSPDGCPELCDDWAQKDSRIRVFHKKNAGLMAAWMDGVRISTGDYLCFVDSDDWIDLCMIEKMLEQTGGSDAEVVCCNYMQEETEKSFPVVQALEPGIYEGERLQEVFGRLLGQERRPITLSRCMKLFSRRLVEENMRYCDTSIVMGEDVNITLPALLSAKRIVILENACWYHYLYLSNSMVHRYDAALYDNILRLSRICRTVLEDKKAPNREEQLQREFILLFFLVVKNEVRSRKKGWKGRLQELCQKEEIQTALREANPVLRARENRILYGVVKYPNAVRLWGLWGLFWVYDLRRR